MDVIHYEVERCVGRGDYVAGSWQSGRMVPDGRSELISTARDFQEEAIERRAAFDKRTAWMAREWRCAFLTACERSAVREEWLDEMDCQV